MSGYEFDAKVIRWIDGDTVVLDVDLGFHAHIIEHFRLNVYDAPEKGKPGYAEALARANMICPVGSTCFVRTHKAHARTFTRWVADVYPNSAASSVSESLTAARLTKADWATP